MKHLFFVFCLFLSFASFAQVGTREPQPLTPATTVRAHCSATTKAGTTCKRWAMIDTKFCTQHSPTAIHCGAPTKAGGACKRVVKTSGAHCAQHSTLKTN